MLGGTIIIMKSILLIHGWDFDNYYGRTSTEAWQNRIKFIKELEKYYKVYYPDLPGFGKEKEPDAIEWNLKDYAKFINDYIIKNNLKIDYILGYSFGGAVSVQYKKIYNSDIKEILASPALIRNEDNSKKFVKTPKIFETLRKKIRDLYLIKIVKNEEMMYGTKFLRNTYQNIVRENMLPTIEKMNPKDFKIIYGGQDDMVNPTLVLNTVNSNLKKRISLINDGGHDIANTHTNKLIKLINDFTDTKEKR